MSTSSSSGARGTLRRFLAMYYALAERNGGEFAGIAVAWLDWQMKKDKRAAKLFVGKNCGLCVNPRWVVSSKNLK